MLHSGRWKLRKVSGTALYHLRDDIGARRDFATEYPEIVQRLAGKMETFAQELQETTRPPGWVAIDGK